MAHSYQTDPGGAFVAERDGRVVGVAEAIRRDQLWILSLLTVDPAAGSRGTGGERLRAALDSVWLPAALDELIDATDKVAAALGRRLP